MNFGCATVTTMPDKDTYQAKNIQPNPNKALVYYLIAYKYDYYTQNISLDGITAKVDQNTFAVWEVAPGEHTFILHNMITHKITQSSLTFRAGGGEVLFFSHTPGLCSEPLRGVDKNGLSGH